MDSPKHEQNRSYGCARRVRSSAHGCCCRARCLEPVDQAVNDAVHHFRVRLLLQETFVPGIDRSSAPQVNESFPFKCANAKYFSMSRERYMGKESPPYDLLKLLSCTLK